MTSTPRARASRDGRDARTGGDVHDVQRAAGRLGELERPLDRRQLGGGRPRGDPRAPVARRPSRAGRPGAPACTATGSPSAAARSMPASSVSSSAASKSSMPLSHMNALKPTTPRPASSSSRSSGPGTSPPQSAKSTFADARAAASLRSKAAPSTVGGWALSGMSMQAVAPPAASAAVPVAQPSQSVRPGSLKCTWASIAPGSTCRPRASSSSPAGRRARARSRRSRRPRSRRRPGPPARPGSTTVPPRTITSQATGRSARARRARRPRRLRRPPRRGCG